jgi:hypothetical protein
MALKIIFLGHHQNSLLTLYLKLTKVIRNYTHLINLTLIRMEEFEYIRIAFCKDELLAISLQTKNARAKYSLNALETVMVSTANQTKRNLRMVKR